MSWPFALWLVLLGPVVGSFLGLLVDRWPLGTPPTAPSRCASCDARLSAVDLIPLWSGVRRTCRHCGAPVPSHLFRIEVAATVGSALAVFLAPDALTALVLAVFLWCLVGLFYADLLHFLLPDPLTLALFCAGLALALVDPGRTVADALLSAGLGVAAFALIRISYRAWRGVEGLGLGDVKLMAGLGAGLGWAALPWVTLGAALLALLVTALDRARVDRQTAVPFGAYLCAAALFFLVIRWGR